MRAFFVIVVALLALAVVAAATARNPRSEQVHLRPADVQTARATLVRAADLLAGWKVDPTATYTNSTADCPASPDLSRFVITGRANAFFKDSSGSRVASHTELYATAAQARKDFQLGEQSNLGKCLKYLMERDKSVDVAVTRVRTLSPPLVGVRSDRYKLEATINGSNQTVRAYVDLLAFCQGRAVGVVSTTGIGRPIDSTPALARLMLSRF